MNIENTNRTVFPIGIYHGNSKPIDSDDFLYEFFMEVCKLYHNGMMITNNQFSVST